MATSQQFALNVRQKSLKMVHKAKASHIGSALSIADIVSVLYHGVMRFDPHDPQHSQRDRFILSKGHACVAVYAALSEVGFISEQALGTYGDDFSPLMNHISHTVPGVEFSSGSLGHGLPFGVGKALAARIRQESWRIFVLLSDGEMDEGSNWEALLFAAHHRLSHLTAIVDYNKLQSIRSISETLALEPLAAKLVAFGCEVHEVNGHDHDQIKSALLDRADNKPTVIIAHTTKGKGVSFMENSVEWHYKNPNDQQLDLALAELEDHHA